MNVSHKKLFTCILILSLAFSLSACKSQEIPTETDTTLHTSDEASATEPSPSNAKTLYQHGLDVISLLDEMLRSELYLTTMTGSSEIQEKAAEIARGNYFSPTAVYEITPLTYNNLLALLDEELAGMGQPSAALQKHLDDKSAGAFFTRLNAQEGSTALATASVFTAGKTFVNGTLTENTVYLYTFKTGYPVVVTFLKGEGGAVSANGTFLLSDLLSLESAEALEDSLADIYLECTVTKVEES